MIDKIDAASGLVVLTGSGTQAFPPATSAVVPETGNGSWVRFDGASVAPCFDLELWAGSAAAAGVAIAVTNAQLFAGVVRPFTIASQAITSVAHGSSTITKNNHGLQSGDGPLRITSDGTVPGGVDGIDVYAIKLGANTFKPAASRALALAGTPIALSTDGTGTISIAGTVETQRLYWTSVGMLGNAGDGAVALDVVKGYRQRFDHRSRCYCYGLVITVDTGTVSVSLYPVVDRG